MSNEQPTKYDQFTQQTIIAVACAIGEQLDLDRLIEAIKKQYDIADKANAQLTAHTLLEIGVQLNELNEKRKRP